jgi:hypothetical protein
VGKWGHIARIRLILANDPERLAAVIVAQDRDRGADRNRGQVREAKDRARPLPSLRRMVFGNAWYERCAKESPPITRSRRSERAGLSALAARFSVLSRRPSDGSIAGFSAKRNSLADSLWKRGAPVVWFIPKAYPHGWRGRSRPPSLVFDDRRRRLAGAPSTWNSAECSRDADRHCRELCRSGADLILWVGA